MVFFFNKSSVNLLIRFFLEKYLFLNINKAKKKLGWKPKLKVEKLIKYTLEWYQNYYSKKDILEFSLKQIKNFGF